MSLNASQLRSSAARAGFPCLVVRDCRIREFGCSLTVEDPSRTMSEVDLGWGPDREGADALIMDGSFPISVKFEFDAIGRLSCSAIFSARGGPVRRELTPGVAIAFCLGGRHTVVSGHQFA